MLRGIKYILCFLSLRFRQYRLGLERRNFFWEPSMNIGVSSDRYTEWCQIVLVRPSPSYKNAGVIRRKFRRLHMCNFS